MSFPAYPSYRDSGVEWLGEVPTHWESKRFKQVFRERDERSEDGDEELLSVSAYTGVRPRREGLGDGEHLSRAESLAGYKRCFPNDLVMNIMLAWNRGLGFSRSNGIVSPAYCVFKVIDGGDPRYLDYLLRSDDYIGYFKCFSAGVIDSRLRLYPDSFLALTTALPPYSEQTAIAAFLDRETAKIDALVEEQRRLIELLKEKRQAVISHAVTKGLDPTVPMKDSGVEWLGQVPAHWEDCKLGHVAKLQSGYAFSSSDFGDVGIPLVRMTNLDRGRLDLSTAVCVPADKSNERVALNAGDLVWGMSGSIGETGSLGNFARVTNDDLPCQLNQRVGRFVVSKGLRVDFLELLIQSESFQKQTILFVTGTAQFNVSAEQVQSIIVAVPPVEEQAHIVITVRGALDGFQRLLEQAEKSINLFHERRSALISAAVTGKIDVRGVTVRQAEAA